MTRSISRMTGGDAGFLYMETPSMHMHTLKIAVLEPSTDNTFDRLIEMMTERLRLLPPMRRRVVPVPFALHHPVLVTQREIDPRRHFFRHHIGGAGTMRDLERLIGEICSTPLDRSVPLWELHLCEGLADGKVAIVGKIHHAMADGLAANAMLANVMDVSSTDMRTSVRTEAHEGVDDPSSSLLVRHALRDAASQLREFPTLIASTVRRLAEVARYRRGMDAKVPLPVKDAPRTSFNGPLTPRRSFATATVPLADLKRVRSTHADIEGLTLNDVVLAVASGALRRWLALHDEHPRTSLTAGVPVGLDATDTEPRLIGNNVSNLFTTLATDVEDPAERLQAISTTTRHAKAISQRLGAALMEWSQFAPPAPFAAAVRAYSRLRGARFHASAFNAIVSNVPGPRERVKVAGAQLADVFSVGPLTEGIGLNITVWSYVDRMNFSLLACPDLLPDVEVLASFIPAAVAELLGEPEPGAAADSVDERVDERVDEQDDAGDQETA
ncbi:wax ester/triacylglycerol synthase family O-acyltransferase [Nocardioides sp. HM23]|uniref:WS/DGAT/MGAT family O-acyltransferase n=1 Tax=Nocardioides bizhenqiangii TaxID=3095076 RepID=UPI002ACAC519|nr:wax ester/triacylglycerol synthase family O-acyltransferase [Nocardioides sp. HM23]MDZ5619775.1 wax ester/triacylglycerol synthase family O-acyltransferase [Nocardioides sp. HM23]